MRRPGTVIGLRTAAVFAVLVLAGSLAACRSSTPTATPSSSGSTAEKSDYGVTKDPCPKAIDKNKGCIYLGIISDLTTGPFAALGKPVTNAQQAFWERVNRNGGIGGKYEVDAVTYVRDNKYNAQTHNEVYQEIKGKVLALAQTLGSPTTLAILEDLKASKTVAVPASWTSAWLFEDNLVESGATYCVESMNAVDYAKETFAPKSVMALHYPGDYGEDAAAGAKYAAEKLGLTFTDVKTAQGQDKQAAAVAAIIAGKPDLVILTTGPTEAAAIVGGAAAQGFKGRFIGTSPTWNPALLASAAGPALKAQYLNSVPWLPYGSDTPGHKAMREALGTPSPLNEGYTGGWAWSYPLKAGLEKAFANGDLTHNGLYTAITSLTTVDYEGMLPSGAGNYKGGAASTTKVTAILKPDEAGPTGLSVVKDYFTGSTAAGFTHTKACHLS